MMVTRQRYIGGLLRLADSLPPPIAGAHNVSQERTIIQPLRAYGKMQSERRRRLTSEVGGATAPANRLEGRSGTDGRNCFNPCPGCAILPCGNTQTRFHSARHFPALCKTFSSCQCRRESCR